MAMTKLGSKTDVIELCRRCCAAMGTAKKDRESIFDFTSDFAVVACDLQLILTLGNHLQLIKNHVMILQ